MGNGVFLMCVDYYTYGIPKPTGSYEHVTFNNDVNNGNACLGKKIENNKISY